MFASVNRTLTLLGRPRAQLGDGRWPVRLYHEWRMVPDRWVSLDFFFFLNLWYKNIYKEIIIVLYLSTRRFKVLNFSNRWLDLIKVVYKCCNEYKMMCSLLVKIYKILVERVEIRLWVSFLSGIIFFTDNYMIVEYEYISTF